MGLDNIVKKLQKEAEQEIEKLQKEAAEKQKEIELAYEEKISQKRQKLLADFTAQVKREMDMELWQEKSNLRKELLMKKKQVIDSIFSKVLDILKNLPEADQEKLIKKYLQEVEDKEGYILPARGSESLIKKCLRGKDRLRLAEGSVAAAGGFIWQSDEVNIDYTWESLVSALRERTELEISKALFG